MPSSFQNLLNIFTSPSLKDHVRTLVYHGIVREKIQRYRWEENIIFPTCSQKPPHPEIPSEQMFTEARAEKYAREVNVWAKNCRPVPFYDRAELDAGWKAYNHMLTGAKVLKYIYAEISSIAASVNGLKNLKTLILVTNRGSFFDIDIKKPARRADLIGNDDDLLNTPACQTEKLSA